MTFTESYLPVSRSEFFSFFAEGQSHMAEFLSLDRAFEICDVRLRLSVIHPSTRDFIAMLIPPSGQWASARDWRMFSVRTSETSIFPDFHWRPSTTNIIFLQNDVMHFSMENSVGLLWGLTVTGWAITG